MAIRKSTVSKKMEEKRQEIIAELWPELDPKSVWHRKKSDGWTTVPRCMPLILDMLNQLSNGNPLFTTYLALWCRSHDEMLVEIKDEKVLAFESGFKGERAVATWKSKMKALMELGFIDARGGRSGDYSYVIIFNPFQIVKKHYKSGSGPINQKSYIALMERAQEVGAKDLSD